MGFLGAGSIILRNEVVKGLTTAASLWTVAAVGLAVGCGLYVPAVAGTGIILVILVGLKPIEERFRRSRQSVEFNLVSARGTMSVGALEKALGGRAARITRLIVSPGEAPDRELVNLGLSRLPAREVEAVLAALAKMPGVTEVRRAGSD